MPVQLQRAMAAEAEAAREARAKVIAAEGEQKAATSLREAATVMEGSPSALQVILNNYLSIYFFIGLFYFDVFLQSRFNTKDK